MQSLTTQRTVVAGQAVRTARPQASRARSVAVVRAAAESSESRRAVLGGLVAGLTGLAVSRANALSGLDVVDSRALQKALDVPYEARDQDLPFAVRDGVAQSRGDIAGTKSRVKESEKRIDNVLEPFIKKNYWTKAREELRLQVGTLRFDLNTLADAKGGKADKKKALALKKNFLDKADDLDYALRSKNEAKASAALAATKSGLDEVLAFVL